MTPALALFYGQTANKKTINYFYRKNIKMNNAFLLVTFAILIAHLNTCATENILNRNVLLGCHTPGTPHTMDEFAIYKPELFK